MILDRLARILDECEVADGTESGAVRANLAMMRTNVDNIANGVLRSRSYVLDRSLRGDGDSAKHHHQKSHSPHVLIIHPTRELSKKSIVQYDGDRSLPCL